MSKFWENKIIKNLKKTKKMEEKIFEEKNPEDVITKIDGQVEDAEQQWDEIAGRIAKDSDSLGSAVLFQKEELKNLLERIRKEIDTKLSVFKSAAFAAGCMKLLERIFDLSENLRASYAFPGYKESIYIKDTYEAARRIIEPQQKTKIY